MAVYRPIHITFWQDKFTLKLTREQKYFYLYLMTNSKTKQCGVYELPLSVISYETGYNFETITKLIKSFIEFEKIEYDFNLEEVFILNWIKYNPVNSRNISNCVIKELKEIKCFDFFNKFIAVFEKLNQGMGREKVEGTYKNVDFTIETVRGLQGAYKGMKAKTPTETETQSKTKSISVSKSETVKDIISKTHTEAIKTFCEFYKLKTGLEYNFIGKDAKQIDLFLKRLYGILTKEKTIENLLSALKYFLTNINDEWILNNLSITILNSKFNEILNKIKNGTRQTNGKGFSSDSPEKWNRILNSITDGKN